VIDQQEALNKINEIHSIMESSNRALFSGERMMVMGALIALIPVLEIFSKGLTFGYEVNDVAIMVVHIVFYWGLFSMIGKVLPYKKKSAQDLHPLIKKAFSLKVPFMVGIFGTMIAFAMVGKFELIHPVVFVLLGLMWCVFGRFSIPAVTYIAYSYIGLGLVYIYLRKKTYRLFWS